LNLARAIGKIKLHLYNSWSKEKCKFGVVVKYPSVCDIVLFLSQEIWNSSRTSICLLKSRLWLLIRM
jgi:hypothetical protein